MRRHVDIDTLNHIVSVTTTTIFSTYRHAQFSFLKLKYCKFKSICGVCSSTKHFKAIMHSIFDY